MKNQDKFERALRFLGYGDPPSAKIWFIGIEEAKPFESLDQIDRLPEKPFKTYQGCLDAPTPIYVIISKIVTGLLGKNWQAEWGCYRDKILFSPGSEAIQTNLYPLGKKNTKIWLETYQGWFDLPRDEYYRLVRDEENGRFALIREKRQEHQCPLTICFGKGDWDEFAKCLDLNETPTEHDVFRVYYESKVILTPFFTPFRFRELMTDTRIGEIISLIDDKGLNPFRV